ncbi:MAG: DUF1080 domain-containing protein [Candidatus Omnitrophica bacterium]|nr:DUF1080 domain-containing protein [Candidatus Omnitrophota bacterium]
MPKITLIVLAIIFFGVMGNLSASIQPAFGEATENEGFIPLFNGVDLTGWTGDTKGYRAEDGILVAEPQGNLYTEAEYGDFVFRFEFKLTPGANNGIGIRVPMNGKASREGLEIQILDDTAEKFAEAKPWQRHGSVYGIIPAKTGHLKPVGEWNQEEIRIQGSQVRVVLNGTEIVNADLQPYIEGEPTLDGKKHPGLKRQRGHLSLAGHKTRIFFRNLTLKPLEPSTEYQ